MTWFLALQWAPAAFSFMCLFFKISRFPVSAQYSHRHKGDHMLAFKKLETKRNKLFSITLHLFWISQQIRSKCIWLLRQCFCEGHAHSTEFWKWCFLVHGRQQHSLKHSDMNPSHCAQATTQPRFSCWVYSLYPVASTSFHWQFYVRIDIAICDGILALSYPSLHSLPHDKENLS